MTNSPRSSFPLTCLVALALLVGCSGSTKPTGTAQVAVPNVVGQSQAAATTALTGAGLVLGSVTTQASSTVASGDVASETPAAGTQVTAGSGVSLAVSSGPAKIAVPNVVGQAQAAASSALTGAGLVVGTVTTQASSTVAAGLILSESPAAGTSVNVGSAVNLVVSSGSGQIAVPNVVGQPSQTASAAITAAGLTVGAILVQPSSTLAAGDVASENPAAGTEVSAGTAVTLFISQGPALEAVPNVVGLTQAAASAAITTSGLVVGTVTTETSSMVAAGLVVSQDPAAGNQDYAGTPVNLIVSTGTQQTTAPLSASNVNLIFVNSQDMVYQTAGGVDLMTGNLTPYGLNQSLLLADVLERDVLGAANVTGIYALEPMTHLQGVNNYPDIAGLETVEQFALLNQITLASSTSGGASVTGNSYPINAGYAPSPVSLPAGVAKPAIACPQCQGLDFRDEGGDNEALVNAIITANVPGFYVFSAPWETVSALMANINQANGYRLAVPTSFFDSDSVYAISVTPVGGATLSTYNSSLNPSSTFPTLPTPVSTTNSCKATPFNITVKGGVGGAVVPSGINTNETLYIIRHAEAHPTASWDDGNYICAGQWRALALPNAFNGKIAPQSVYAIDPAQAIGGTADGSGRADWSYVRPALTVEPYVIANNLPYYLAASYELGAPTDTGASNYFFTGGQLSNQTALLAYEHAHIPLTIAALLASYYPNGGAPTTPTWSSSDYDSIWTVSIDANGNLTVDNNLCEGISSASLPATCPKF